jgi:hypothetical protein
MTIYRLPFNQLTLFIIHFSVPLACPVGCAVCYPIGVFSVAKNTHLLCGCTFNQKCSIMQNKPNFQKVKMKLTSCSTKDYENKLTHRTPKNKPNQTQFQKASPLRILEKSSGLMNAAGPLGLCFVSIFSVAANFLSRGAMKKLGRFVCGCENSI